MAHAGLTERPALLFLGMALVTVLAAKEHLPSNDDKAKQTFNQPWKSQG